MVFPVKPNRRHDPPFLDPFRLETPAPNAVDLQIVLHGHEGSTREDPGFDGMFPLADIYCPLSFGPESRTGRSKADGGCHRFIRKGRRQEMLRWLADSPKNPLRILDGTSGRAGETSPMDETDGLFAQTLDMYLALPLAEERFVRAMHSNERP